MSPPICPLAECSVDPSADQVRVVPDPAPLIHEGFVAGVEVDRSVGVGLHGDA
jgi:hypothetical protein